MSFTLAQAVEARLTPDVIGKVAGATGETPTRTKAAMSAGVLAVIAGFVRQASTAAGVSNLLVRLRSEPAQKFAARDDELDRGIDPQNLRTRGEMLGPSMLGEGTGSVAEAVSRSSGVAPREASSIVAMLVPIATGVLGREVVSRRLDDRGLSSMMLDEKRALLARPDLPSGVAGIMSERMPGAMEQEAAVASGRRDVSMTDVPIVREQRAVVPEHRRHFPWAGLIGALAIAALLIIAGVSALRSQRRGVTPPTVEAPTARAPIPPTQLQPGMQRPEMQRPSAPQPNAPAEEPTSQATTTGAQLTTPEGLATHFSDTAVTPDRFTLPNVGFEFGSSKLTPGSDTTIDRVAQLMKEHPASRVRIEGNTDSTGTQDVNAPLSYERAQTVKRMLVTRGIDPNRIETIGRSDHAPVAPNTTRQGRAQNRGVDMVILAR